MPHVNKVFKYWQQDLLLNQTNVWNFLGIEEFQKFCDTTIVGLRSDQGLAFGALLVKKNSRALPK